MKMKITLTDGMPASKEAVQELEAALGFPISDSFRRFVSQYDGSTPSDHSFPVGEDNASRVRRFIPVSNILEEREYIDNIPVRAYPIADDDCGNYVLLDEGTGGKIYFWDHEFEDDNIIHLADSFDEFLSMLKPYNADPGAKSTKVKSVWVHPDLQKIIDAQKKDKS